MQVVAIGHGGRTGDGGRKGVFIKTAKSDFNDLFGALVGETIRPVCRLRAVLETAR